MLAGIVVIGAAGSPSAAVPQRCTGDLAKNVCAEATGVCPPFAPVGPNPSDWGVYQHDVQHTGKTPVVGPTCATPTVLWSTKLKGSIKSAPFLGSASPGQLATIYTAEGHFPVCALEPTAGGVLWCNTDQLGRDVGFGNATAGNGNMIYVGTRDNDLWAITKPSPEVPGSAGFVNWRQKICTDGDVVTPPIIGKNGLVYMGSDSLESGTLMAMCPGPNRVVKWCINPVGGPVSDVSPALSPNGKRLYVTHSGAFLISLNAKTGEKKWEVQIEKRRNNGREMNFTPVVDPTTGRIYLGFDEGLYTIDVQVNGSVETPIVNLLFPTYTTPDRTRIQAPPVLDHAHDAIYFGASRGRQSKLYAVSFAGALKWSRDLSLGAFKNNPPVVDGAGKIYVAMKTVLHAFNPAGTELWTVTSKELLLSSPIIDDGRIYLGTRSGSLRAIGCAP